MASNTGANFSLDVTRRRGETYAEEFRLVDGTGAPIDITGRSFILTVNALESPTDSDPDLYELTATITDASAALYEFPITQIQADSAAADYFFDIKMTYNPGTGNVTRVVGGGDWHIIQGIS